MLQSMVVAFSMYSKIPMPKITWTKKNMKYALCFFPMVGAAVALVLMAVLWVCRQAGFGTLFTASAAALVPVLVTGGIHLDGYLDTIDALSSYGDREKKLEILKDSNSGAFAIIYGLVYFVANIAVWTEMDKKVLPFVCISFVMSRTLSALSIVSFPLAKNTGLAATFQDGAHKKRVKIVMICFFLIEAVGSLFLNPLYGGVLIVLSLVCFGIHYYLCKKTFGGITGDLAGFFLQICELLVLFGLMLSGR